MIYIAFLIITIGFLLMVAAFNKLWGIVQILGCQLSIQGSRIAYLAHETDKLSQRVAKLEGGSNEQD